MKLQLRDYQIEAIEKVKWSLTIEGNDLLQLPTGAGKSIVIAELANHLNQNVLILQPTVEILEQNVGKLSQYVDQDEIGIYSASVGEKVIKKYTFATIGSVYKIPEQFRDFKVVLLDECHLLNPKETGSMFLSFLNAIGNPKVIGLSATVYRIFPTYFVDVDKFGNRGLYQSNSIKVLSRVLDKKGGKPFWNRIVFKMDPHELIDKGYLCPLQYVDKTTIKQEMVPLNKSRTDFDMEAYDKIVAKMDQDIVSLIQEAEMKHKFVLVFCNSISQSERLAGHFPNSKSISSKSTKKERADIIGGFKEGRYRVIFNVGVLTTGFDHPELDSIVLLRPTRSVALYYQMLGRGVRLAPNKTHCTVYDWSDTVKRIGRLETIKLEKVEGKWNVTTEAMPDGWHGKELYKFVVRELSTPKKPDTLFT
jgi:DNA repair protein RadD